MVLGLRFQNTAYLELKHKVQLKIKLNDGKGLKRATETTQEGKIPGGLDETSAD